MNHVPDRFVIGKNEAAEGILPAKDAVAKVLDIFEKLELPEGMQAKALTP